MSSNALKSTCDMLKDNSSGGNFKSQPLAPESNTLPLSYCTSITAKLIYEGLIGYRVSMGTFELSKCLLINH